MISIPFQGKPFNMSIIEVYGSTTDGKEAEANQFYEDLQDFLELTPKKTLLIVNLLLCIGDKGLTFSHTFTDHLN